MFLIVPWHVDEVFVSTGHQGIDSGEAPTELCTCNGFSMPAISLDQAAQSIFGLDGGIFTMAKNVRHSPDCSL